MTARRPTQSRPGYGIGYTIGALQMQRLLADRKRQLGNEFDLRQFHDEFINQGWSPLSMIRWQMTGLDDEIKQFWKREPMPNTVPNTMPSPVPGTLPMNPD